jgi:hypothetical protein
MYWTKALRRQREGGRSIASTRQFAPVQGHLAKILRPKLRGITPRALTKKSWRRQMAVQRIESERAREGKQ